jgi:hypothetical protein
LASSTAKHVVVYRFERQPVDGFVNPTTFLLADGIELLTKSGAVQTIPYSELKAVCFIGEPSRSDLFETPVLFERRPRIPGLWTRFTLRDGDQIDGVLPHNLADWPAAGFMFTPPRAPSLGQRVFVPRNALAHTEFQGVIDVAAGAKAKPSKKPPVRDGQLEMFES